MISIIVVVLALLILITLGWAISSLFKFLFKGLRKRSRTSNNK